MRECVCEWDGASSKGGMIVRGMEGLRSVVWGLEQASLLSIIHAFSGVRDLC